MRLQGKTAVVTGGGSGIGRAIAQVYASNGASVVVSDIIGDRAVETVAAMAAQAEATFGRIDILVNNAGLSVGDDILTIDEADWDFNLEVGLKSVFLCAKAILPGMIEQKSGVILNITSVNGMFAVGEEG